MNKFSHSIINNKGKVFIIFLTITIICAVLSVFVDVNYKMIDYLPNNAQSTTAIKIMKEEFNDDISNASIMVSNVSINEALEYKKKISEIDGVKSVSWLDDVIGLDSLKTTPLEFLDKLILKSYYVDNNALISISIESGKEKDAVKDIYEVIGKDNAASGEAITTAETQAMSVTEVLNAMLILIPLVLIILIFSTSSWLEPMLFIISIGIAIVINMGTNIIFGEVSFITSTVSPILQLAVSLDYAIFLLHSFNEHCIYNDPKEAMLLAMKKSLNTIAASAATTIIGFAALVFMRFGIGTDLGLNLLKGVTFSFISVMVFLPVLTLLCYKGINKTKHRKLTPSFKSSGSILHKIRIPCLILTLIIVIPCYLAQKKTEFMYGMSDITSTSRVGKDTLLIEEKFGKTNPLVLLVPKENTGKENELCKSLSSISHVTNITAYVTVIGESVPTEYVPKEIVNKFYSENYSRLIINTDTEEESTETFKLIEEVLNTTKNHYNTYYLTGQSAALFDMKSIIETDTKTVNTIAVVGIFIVLLITFKSISLPLFLVISIETAIWINLSIPYFSGKSLSFIGYLIISTVQLGATVDYAILLTNSFLSNKKELRATEAMKITIINNIGTILTSAMILSLAGFTLSFTTNNPIISELGILLGRGTLLSFTIVLCVLPALLILFDKTIEKTTKKLNKI